MKCPSRDTFIAMSKSTRLGRLAIPSEKRRMDARKQLTAVAVAAEPNPVDSSVLVPASKALQDLLDNLPADHFTLGWLSSHLHRRSFGFIALILALIAIVPGISYVAGLLLLAPAIEMIAGHRAPTFPGGIANRPLPTRHLTVAVQRAVPILKFLEKMIRPRWRMPPEAMKRLVGVALLMLTLLLLLTPFLLSRSRRR